MNFKDRFKKELVSNPKTFTFVSSPVVQELPTVTLNGKRYYQTPENNLYPSVTTVLSSEVKRGLENWKQWIGEEEANKIRNRAANRGTVLHNIVELYITGQYELLNKALANPFAYANFMLVKPIIDQHVNNVYCQETALYSDQLRVAGRVDLIAEFNGKLSVIDFKGANKDRKASFYKSYYMQTAAYSQMYYERTGIEVPNTVLIFAVEGERGKYVEMSSEKYLDKFISLRNNYVD